MWLITFLALKALFKKPAAFMKKFSVRNLKLGALLDIMDILGLDDSQQKMADVIQLIKVRVACGNLWR